ncbi:MAG: hypothetical protein WD733_11225 [Bryobacterales bacterium]
MKLRQLFPIAAVSFAALAAPLVADAQQAVRIPDAQAGVRTAAGPGTPAWQSAGTFEFIAAGPAFGGETVKDSPYSAEAVSETKQTLADGNKIGRTTTSKIYRDGQGRTRREEQISALGPWSSAGEPREVVFINDPAAGTRYVVDPTDRTAQKTEMHFRTMVDKIEDGAAEEEVTQGSAGPGEATAGVAVGGATFYKHIQRETRQAGEGELHDVTVVHSAGQPNFQFIGDNMQTESLGTRMIEGVEAQGTRTTTTIPAGQIGNELPIEIVSESWLSPQLQTLVLSKHSDPRMGETTYRLTNIQLIEPLPMLFEVPADYTIQEGPRPTFIKQRIEAPGRGQGGQ